MEEFKNWEQNLKNISHKVSINSYTDGQNVKCIAKKLKDWEII